MLDKSVFDTTSDGVEVTCFQSSWILFQNAPYVWVS
jgi:hypothetical protein